MNKTKCVILIIHVWVALQIVIDAYGCISSSDTETAVIFQYDEQELEGFDIMTLIPSIKLPGSDDVLTKVYIQYAQHFLVLGGI